MEIAAHTPAHTVLSVLVSEGSLAEISDCSASIENSVAVKPKCFANHFGDPRKFRSEYESIVGRQCRFCCIGECQNNVEGLVDPRSFRLKTIAIGPEDSHKDFLSKLEAHGDYLASVQRTKHFFHFNVKCTLT